jgi:hypothetical protein
MIDLSDIAALPHGEGKAVAISLYNERLRLKSQMKDLKRKKDLYQQKCIIYRDSFNAAPDIREETMES